MSYAVIATLVAQPESVDEVGRLLAELAPASRSEPGCLQYEVLRDRSGDATFVVVERYVDEAAFEAHRTASHFQRLFVNTVIPLLENRSAGFYTSLPTPGRVALVFGGASGINRATATLLARRQCRVVVADVDGDGAEAVADAIRSGGEHAVAMSVDVADRAAIAACVERVVAEHGRLDVLITGAGHLALTPIDDLTEAVLDRMLDVHLKGTIHAVQAALPHLRASGAGRVVCLSSAAARRGSANHHHYAAAKAGIVGFVRSLALQEAGNGVTVNAVLPGPIDTPMLQALSDEQREALAAAVPVGRLGTPEDVARVVCALAAEDAGFVTGTTSVVAGGSTL